MDLPQHNRRLIVTLSLFICAFLVYVNPTPVAAVAPGYHQWAQATIPAEPNFCALHGFFDRYPPAAVALGVAHETLWVELHDDQSIADFAQARQVELQGVIDAIVSAEREHVQLLVEQGCMTEATAAVKVAGLTETITTFVHDRTPPTFVMCRVGVPGYDELTAQLLGLDTLSFYRALRKGNSLVTLAEAHGFNRDRLIEELVEAKLAVIQGLVDTHCIAANDGALWRLLIPVEVPKFVERGVDAESMRYWSNVIDSEMHFFFMPLLMK